MQLRGSGATNNAASESTIKHTVEPDTSSIGVATQQREADCTADDTAHCPALQVTVKAQKDNWLISGLWDHRYLSKKNRHSEILPPAPLIHTTEKPRLNTVPTPTVA